MPTGLATASACAALALAATALAPMQCSSERDPAYATEETPGEALYRLAEELRAGGDEAARKKTLRYLIARYPSSRFAVTARDDLAAAGDPVP